MEDKQIIKSLIERYKLMKYKTSYSLSIVGKNKYRILHNFGVPVKLCGRLLQENW